MADAVVILPDDSGNTGKDLDATSLTVGANTVYRQRINLADPTTATNIASVTAQDVKGTFALQVQPFHETGRTFVSLTADQVAGTTTTAFMTLLQNSQGATTSATTYTVPAGKVFRVQSFNAGVQQNATTALVSSRIYIVASSAALATTMRTTQVVDMLVVGASATTVNAAGFSASDIAEGIEIPAAWNVGVLQITLGTTVGLVSVSVNGYLY